ncbi:MAG: hypothetical protein D6794_07990, partial [Deltaproteobacteria bacterium]
MKWRLPWPFRPVRKSGFVLALGGGGGRGLAHVGVLEVLEQHKLMPNAIVGTSIGALFGVLYALRPDAANLRRQAMAMIESDTFEDLDLPVLDETETGDWSWLARIVNAAKKTALFTKAATDIAVADTDALRALVAMYTKGKSFSDTKIPVFVTAVKFPSGECRLFSREDRLPLADAIAASMAIPGVFDPVAVDGDLYVDGGLASELPAREARMVAREGESIVAVNVGARPRPDVRPDSVYGMLDWASQIKS